MKNHQSIHQQPNAGFTLFELLLVIGISALLILGVAQIAQSWAQNEAAKNVGIHFSRVNQAVKDYAQRNWTTLTETNHATNSVTSPAGWDGLPGELSAIGLADGTGVITSPDGFEIRIAFQIDTSGPTRVFRTIVYGTELIENKKLGAIARQAGEDAGTFQRLAGTDIARGTFNQWLAPVAVLQTPDADNVTIYPIAPNATSGYLLGISEVLETAAAGAYLYRTDVDGDTTLNTMSTDLILTNGNITGIDTLTANNAVVSGTATIQGPATVATNVIANNINTPSLTTNNITLNSGGAITSATPMQINGSVTITGTTTAPSIKATECIKVAGTVYPMGLTCD
jgi:type II secretory pathway pseudopilin PulG